MPKKLILNAFVMAPGHHAAAWRHPHAEPDRTLRLPYFLQIAHTAERGNLDALFFADTLTIAGQGGRGTLEPLTLLAALAAATERIGLIATASTTYTEPFNLARTFASLDHLSGGRIGWNIVTSSTAEAAANFGRQEMPHGRRYRRADEYLEVVTRLWDSWADDARILNKETGVALAPGRVQSIDHLGDEFQVRGPLNVPRSPQGHPVLVQAGSSPDGRAFAARWAEVVFTAAQTLSDAQGFYTDLKTRVSTLGRAPDHVKVLPGISPFLGSTEAEARALRDKLDEIAVPADAVDARVWPELGGVDLSRHPLDEPVPLHLLPDPREVQGNRSRFSLIVNLARRERLTLRQLLRRLAGARGHLTVAGTPRQVADLIEHWFTHGAADGFNVMPPLFPDQFDAFVDEVVPILRARGLTRSGYPDGTLREYYGLPRPTSRHAESALLA